MITIFCILFLIFIFISLTKVNVKGYLTMATVLVIAVLSGFLSVKALYGYSFIRTLPGTLILGELPIVIDSLSAWFILTINFTFVTGAIYGLSYMKQYKTQKANLTFHCIAFIIAQLALNAISMVQSGLFFLIFWEIMAVSVFVLVIFEHYKPETLRAGINYLIQSHISIVFIMLAFIYIAYKTGNYSFYALTEFAEKQSKIANTVLFLCFFTGFAIKAGFVPFHTWLPHAHPAAPSHVSGIMSGVIIKIGIYGILRVLLILKPDYQVTGFIILFISLISGVYGVMLAIIQHNLKKLLAYHSIENIGIIGIGIGLGTIGLGINQPTLIVLGFAGALLHTLNHSLFKSLLFFTAGNIYQQAHTMNIERFGGIIKKMPETAILFLLASVAICGLPPLNGFISEFLIYKGIYSWFLSADQLTVLFAVFSVFGLVTIGGLAMLCFTKAFGIVFLGNPRHEFKHLQGEVSKFQILPLYIIAIFIIFIGFFPATILSVLNKPLGMFLQLVSVPYNLNQLIIMPSFDKINIYFTVFILLIIGIILLRKISTQKKDTEQHVTWGCGYKTTNPKLQYTANSFVRSYAKLAKPLLDIEKRELHISGIFPEETVYETHSYDKVERYLVDKPLKIINKITNWFAFLQTGNLQRYILYGIIFIATVIIIPLVINNLCAILDFLNNL